MANRNELIATPVTDKNGVMTTRWKRPVGASAGTESIPAPPVPTRPIDLARGDIVTDEDTPFTIAALLSDMLYTESATQRVVEMFRTQLHQETLDILDQHYGENYLPILQFAQRCIREESVASLNNAALFIHMRDECWDGAAEDRERMFEKYIFGLQWHHSVNHLDFRTLENGEHIGEALLKTASNLGRPYAEFSVNGAYSIYYLPSRHLVQLITERYKDVDAIVNLLDSRRLPVRSEEDVEAVKEILGGTSASSLGSGVL